MDRPMPRCASSYAYSAFLTSAGEEAGHATAPPVVDVPSAAIHVSRALELNQRLPGSPPPYLGRRPRRPIGVDERDES